ncbi:phosphoenolpyruvate--protein phosphotransferase [Pseudonocardiaceae bacterium YIM PH 21723]|nr:phosphoenolpyruvate--protein phosphotransferase [Pseudonocardiaceae bacterium YIM PH 21723]
MGGKQLGGVGVSPGRAVGPVVKVAEALVEPAVGGAVTDIDAEAGRILPASEAVAARLRAKAETVEGESRTLLETTAAMAADPSLLSQAEQLVKERGLHAPRAVWEAAGGFAEALTAAGGYLAERAQDVLDVRNRIVAELEGLEPPGVPELTEPSVLVAKDLAPADTAGLNPELVLALVTEEGGPTSHTAILARSLGIPAVVACRGLLAVEHFDKLIVNGQTGQVELTGADTATVRSQAFDGQPTWSGSGVTKDGHRVKVLGNVGKPADSQAAAAAGAEGVGLFRTEFCFLSATEEPSEEEQRAAYAAVLAPFAGKPVTVRTLDAGADKPLAFLSVEGEPNPALGVRGIRLSMANPSVLDRQLAAIAAAAADTGADVQVMAPMVATAEEASWFVTRARAAGLARAGVMIEVPAAALAAASLLPEVDFLSLGTNDLAQYLFAADRMLGAVAQLNNPWQPALLELISIVADRAATAGKPVGVCGEAAGDPVLACVLTGLGVTSLSMSSGALAPVGATLAQVSLDDCQLAARVARHAADPIAAATAARTALGLS